jgi:hypothetical protein
MFLCKFRFPILGCTLALVKHLGHKWIVIMEVTQIECLWFHMF